MPIPSSGAIRMGADIGVETGNTATAQISLGAAKPRQLAGVASGAIRLAADFYGKSLGFTFSQTISSDTTNYNLKSAAISGGWNQVLPLTATVTINNGIFVYSTSTGSYAFDTGSTFPTGTSLNLINNGTILGKGGGGGAGTSGQAVGNAGSSAGPAFIARANINVTNNGTIGGGGGGGGGGGSATPNA